MDFSTAAILGVVTLKLTDLVKFVTNGQYKATLTQALVYLVGITVVILAGAANLPDLPVVGDLQLDELNLSAQILVGIAGASLGSVVYDVKRAIDNTDSAVTPNL